LQDRLGQQITVPARPYFSREDIQQMSAIRHILESGMGPSGIESIDLDLKEEEGIAEATLKLFEGTRKIGFRMLAADRKERVLDS